MVRERRRPVVGSGYAAAMPELAELCRVHDVGPELVERSGDIGELLQRLLDDYERNRGAPPDGVPDHHCGAGCGAETQRLRALVTFAGEAAALAEQAGSAALLRARTDALESAKRELQAARGEQQRTRRRLDDVLSVLDAGILITGPEGRVEHANRAASELSGIATEDLIGASADTLVAGVARKGDGEWAVPHETGGPRVLRVARRELRGEASSEIILLAEPEERAREDRTGRRMARLAELLRTLAVMTHKINNPLTSLMGRAQILLMRKDLDPGTAKAANVIDESARRIADHVRELAGLVHEGQEEAIDRLPGVAVRAPAGEDGAGNDRKGS